MKKRLRQSSSAARLLLQAEAKTMADTPGKSRPHRPPGQYVLRLYVAGATLRSRQAVLRLRQLCATELQDNCDLEVIDIYQQPALARAQQIVATPTLIIGFPRLLRRLVGNLINLAGLSIELDLASRAGIAR